MPARTPAPSDPLEGFHPAVRRWFEASFEAPTPAQVAGWPAIRRGDSSLILAPTGSGKTLAAFLWAINRIMFAPQPPRGERCRILYISPLKALAVDVERNLRKPIAGIRAQASDTPLVVPAVSIRTGDTPQSERARFLRDPADILITTPESLFLLLTSRARDGLRSIDTVIIDEIHALVPTKRGAHLALSLERLEALCKAPPQRIGLSATQRPLDEVARFLAGVPAEGLTPAGRAEPRNVSIIDTGERKQLSLEVNVPVEDMSRLDESVATPGGPSAAPAKPSIWPAIHPRLLELIRAHRSTLIFVNSRRLAERLAGALNELAGETIALAHHGSVARDQRVEIEDRLKSGELPALVATSSLELGIDMGAIDLVVQIEAPPTVAAGVQRIGRAGHRAGEVSSGIIVPKFRGDLLACAAVTEAMLEGRIERIRYLRNPLDVLAQQIVAIVSMDRWTAGDLYEMVRRAAPFADLSRSLFDGVLDMLSGVYPSDEFSGLRPRITWDRIDGTITARPGARHVAIANAGTIPDRGLYSVFLAGATRGGRVGELDEEMVFESGPGETFILGATTWRIEDITHDRVVVSPASGEPGKMPFWKGDGAGRSAELGAEIGALTRKIRSLPAGRATAMLARNHGLDTRAARNLVDYLRDQHQASGVVPDDETIVIERTLDEMGAWRVCVLSPLGARIHAPWAMAATAKIRSETAMALETMWTDDGFVVRFPESDLPPDPALLIPGADEVESLVVGQLGATSLFASRFRESAARALLLPRRRAGERAPLWQQRKRALDLLQVATRFASFPMILEAYRECLSDVFDMRSLTELMRRVQQRKVRVVTVDSEQPSPFAASVLFRYVANYLYDGDAPLAERRAQALAVDPSQLRELLGDPDLRRLLDADAIADLELRLARLDEASRVHTADAIHDLLLSLGDLSRDEIEARCASAEAIAGLDTLLDARRVIEISIRGRRRFIAIEDASRYRDALGVPLPAGIPERLLQPVADPAGDLVHRFARTHGPFSIDDLVQRYALARGEVEKSLEALAARGRVVQGEFRPRGHGIEWCEAGVLRTLRRHSLARLRHEAEPVSGAALARALSAWQGAAKPRPGIAALVEVIETLQGCPVPASVLESDILPARVAGYSPGDLDRLIASGEVVWLGVEPLGERDGRIALFLTSQVHRLAPRRVAPDDLGDVERSVLESLGRRGARFFPQVAADAGVFPNEVLDGLWSLVWRGLVVNDTMHGLRAYTRPPSHARRTTGYRPLGGPASSEGRWSLAGDLFVEVDPSEWTVARAQQFLRRYPVVTRDAIASESETGVASAIVDVLRGLEERGRIRRGYFVEGIPAMQFADAAALDLLRSKRTAPESPEVLMLAATDPANPWGSILPWPQSGEGRLPARAAGAHVILVDGELACWIAKGDKQLRVFLPEDEPRREKTTQCISAKLSERLREGGRRALLIGEIDGSPAAEHRIAPHFRAAGFIATAAGALLLRR